MTISQNRDNIHLTETSLGATEFKTLNSSGAKIGFRRPGKGDLYSTRHIVML